MSRFVCHAEGGYEVHVVTDAVSSSRLGDRATAIQVASASSCRSEPLMPLLMD